MGTNDADTEGVAEELGVIDEETEPDDVSDVDGTGGGVIEGDAPWDNELELVTVGAGVETLDGVNVDALVGVATVVGVAVGESVLAREGENKLCGNMETPTV